MKWIDALKEIRRAKNKKQLIVFVGAGVSRNSGIPTWSGLISVFADRLQYDHCAVCKDRNCCDEKIKENCNGIHSFSQEEFLRIPEYYYQKDKKSYYDLINEVLNQDAEPNEIDNEILRIAPSHIITTNYDDLLERANSVNTGLYSVIAKDEDLLSKVNNRYIIKMHGDFSCIEKIVLKESDYINYEHNYILISTFIKSLLVNNTFLFVGYSLSDYNLNLIIGWINYFAKEHGVENRPKSYILESEDVSALEKERLLRKNIVVVETNSIDTEMVNKYASSKLTHYKGRQIHAFLRLVSDDAKYREVVPFEQEVESNYALLSAYNHIAYSDLKKNCHINNLEYIGNTLYFSNEEELIRFENAYKNSSELRSLISKTCIEGAKAYHSQRTVSLADRKERDELFQNCINNDFASIQKKLQEITNPVKRLYYTLLLGAPIEEIDSFVDEVDKEINKSDLVSILLSKMRIRYVLPYSNYYGESQQTKEIIDLFASLDAYYRNATGYLYKLFHSESDDHIAMQELLDKQESQYRYKINGFISGHAFQNIWRLQTFAYEYYYFFKENYLPIDYYANVKNYLSYYLRAILCSYSPIAVEDESGFIHTHREHYPLEEIDLDMFVKYTDPKALKKWIEDYNVDNIEFAEEQKVPGKLERLCDNAVVSNSKQLADYIYSFSILVARAESYKLKEKAVCIVIRLLKTLIVDDINRFDDVLISKKLLESALILLKSVKISEHSEVSRICRLLMQVSVNTKLHNKMNRNYEWGFSKLFNLSSSAYNNDFKAAIYELVNIIEDISERLKAIKLYRKALPMDRFAELLVDNMKSISTETIFTYIFEGYIEPNKACEQVFLEEIEKLHLDRINNPNMRALPDYLQINIDDYIILHLVTDVFDIKKLEKYKGYCKCIEFLLAPKEFDYSKVDTSDYMWTNIITTKKYQHYFLEHREELMGGLREAINNNTDTRDQQKILYGLLTPKEDLWKA